MGFVGVAGAAVGMLLAEIVVQTQVTDFLGLAVNPNSSSLKPLVAST